MTEFFLRRYREICPDVTMEHATKRQALRVNTSKTTAKELIATLTKRDAKLEKIPWLENGYWIEADFSPGATQEYLLGHYYLQGPLSQLTCEILKPKGRILDMAAAPGGKTTYLAQMSPDSVVIALDNDAARLAVVRNNVERLGLPNVVCVKKDARFVRDLGERFDSIILDAPCSGNFCSESGWAEKRTLQDIKANARVQRELLKAAYFALETGGSILYSTCSLEPEEDELVVDWLLKKYENIDLVPIELEIGDQGAITWNGKDLDKRLSRTRRFWPHKTGEEGFFMALLRRA
ncbi:RsmB/NOP family class I SAM-dependent RNA methyltransferase [Candidatus Woesearchaeota archaeon]|nr:RsmB/NOP family class I SAM-dependent RNA methyltransferase [Candidatus Woesearchaeota archaeon]